MLLRFYMALLLFSLISFVAFGSGDSSASIIASCRDKVAVASRDPRVIINRTPSDGDSFVPNRRMRSLWEQRVPIENGFEFPLSASGSRITLVYQPENDQTVITVHFENTGTPISFGPIIVPGRVWTSALMFPGMEGGVLSVPLDPHNLSATLDWPLVSGDVSIVSIRFRDEP